MVAVILAMTVTSATIIFTACGPIATEMTDNIALKRSVALNHHSLLPLKAVVLTLPRTAAALLLLRWIQILDRSRIESPGADTRIEVEEEGMKV